MSKINKEFTRRNFIKYLGAAAGMGIPLLNSSVAMGQTSKAPLRLLFISLAHGWGYRAGIENISGSEYSFTLPTYLRVFDEIKNQMVFIDGLRTSFWGNAHDVSYADLLTCAARPGTKQGLGLPGAFPPPHAPSIDWFIEQETGKPTLRLSHNYRGWGFGFNPMCYGRSPSGLYYLSSYTTPRSAFMGILDPMRGEGGAIDKSIQAHNEFLLSGINKNANRLLSLISGREREKIESYLLAVDDLGKRIGAKGNGITLPLPANPPESVPFADGLDNYLELIKICFQMDTHRTAVLGIGQGASGWTWKDPNGITRTENIFGGDFHHEVGHYNEAVHPGSRAAFESWIRWHAAKVVNFVKVLAATPDVDGNKLIDNTLIVLSGEVGDGQHSRSESLHMLIGGGTRIKRGRWIQTERISRTKPQGHEIRALDPDGNPTLSGWGGNQHLVNISVRHAADMWTRIGQLMGLNITKFGDYIHNNGPLDL